MNLAQENIWINVNKPLKISSARVVSIVKRYTKAKKVGHGGTLDIMASGVLPVAINKATKTSSAMMSERKKYSFRVKWGSFTDSDDGEGKITQESEKRPKTSQISAALISFMGAIEQVPSKFSAIKVDGKRAYDLARKGVEFSLKSRSVSIYSLKLIQNNEEYGDFEVECSKGTYVRSLARDICEILDVCGHVSRLERLMVGDFLIKNSISLEQLRDFIRNPALDTKIEEAKWTKDINFTCNN